MKPAVKPRSHLPEFSVWVLFAVITGIAISNHVMWRDEWQAILLSYKSKSLINLWHVTKDEGHPMLWFVLLYLAKFIGYPTIVPKILHYLIAVSYCGVVLFYTPFSRIVKFALVFSYFFVFEYAVITRDYGLSVLLIFSVMALWKKRHEHKWAFALLLFLLSQSIFYATMMTGIFVLFLIAEPWLLNNKWQFNSKDLLFEVIGSIGVILSLISCARANYYNGRRYGFVFDMHHLSLALDNIYNSFIPIPEFTHNCWNSILPDSDYLRALYSIIIMAVVIYFLRADRRALLFFVAYLILHELFAYFYFLGYMRHGGYLFIAAIVAFWFYYMRNPKAVLKPLEKVIIGGVLVLQVFVACYFLQDDSNDPFSEDAEAATFLRDNHLDHLVLYGHPIYSTTGITGYLDKPIIDVNNLKPYYAIPWGEIHFPISDSMLQAHFTKILAAQDSCILILDYVSPFISVNLGRGYPNIIPLKAFTNSNMTDENFYIYLLKK